MEDYSIQHIKSIRDLRNIYSVTVAKIDAGQSPVTTKDLTALSSGVYFVC